MRTTLARDNRVAMPAFRSTVISRAMRRVVANRDAVDRDVKNNA
jgi:hypothetical protein